MLCCMMFPFSLTMLSTLIPSAKDSGDDPDYSQIGGVNIANYSIGEVILFMTISLEQILKVLFFLSSPFWCSSPCFSLKNRGGRTS